MNISIQGHSGCDIEIVEKEDSLLVLKSTKDKNYFKRLQLQAYKQQNDNCIGKNILTPEIYEIKETENEAHILMDYIYANNFVDFFEHASSSQINNFISVFINYITEELCNSPIQNISKDIFINKFNSVCNNCEKNELLKDNENVKYILEKSKVIFDNLDDYIKIPIGKCHGDLTFSNILFATDNIYFIDYLDSFIETPIQDIVKLRQDTKYFWSVMMYHNSYDIVRLNMIFKYIDTQIDNFFKNVDSYNDIYDTLQLMNILRILPYVKEEKIKNFVINILMSLV